jgi:phage/plasmid-like protein (TIGR03299 family)
MTNFSARTVPWMVVGTQIDEAVDVQTAAKLAGLDFTVSLRDIQWAGKQIGTDFGDFVTDPEDVEWNPAPSRKAVVRDDTDEFYDVVSSDYSVVQYSEALDFLSQLNPLISAAGTLKGGRQGFMVVQLTDLTDVQMPFKDEHKLFAVVRTSHDRSRGVECSVMPLRMRCMNQLSVRAFSAGVKNRWSITHVGNAAGKLHNAEELVQRVKDYHNDFVNTADRLYHTVIDVQDADKILHSVFKPTGAEASKHEEVIAKVLDMWQHRDETVGFAGTGWGLFNAVSEYMEWERTGAGRTAQSQFLGALEGSTRKALDQTAGLILSRFAA